MSAEIHPEDIEGLAGEMTLMGHLDELRKRLTLAAAAVVITTLFSFIFARQLIDILAYPLDETVLDAQGNVTQFIPGVQKLESIEVTENFSVFMSVALTSGVILAMPMLVYQLIAFIVPGLTDAEKRVLFVGIPAASILFIGGVSFAYYIAMPPAISFLTNFMDIPTALRPKDYFRFVTRLIFWIGVSFELPLVLGLLARLGVLSPEYLIKNARYAVVIIAIMAALITPTPDPLNMGLVMGPLLVLYGFGIFLAKLLYVPREAYHED